MPSVIKIEKQRENEIGMKDIRMTHSINDKPMTIGMVIVRLSMKSMVGNVPNVVPRKTCRFITGTAVGITYQRRKEIMTSLISYCYAGHVTEDSMEGLMGGRVVGIAVKSVVPLLFPITHMDYAGIVRHLTGTINTARQESRSNKDIVQAGVKASGQLVDEVWATDLPHELERKAIFEIHLRKRKRDPLKFDTALLAKRSEDMTGAEIEACIEDALFAAFDSGKEVTTKHILTSIKETIPQAQRDQEELRAIREWVETRARLVSSPIGESSKASVRTIHPKKRNIK